MGALKPIFRPQLLRQALIPQHIARPAVFASSSPSTRASSSAASRPAPTIPEPTPFCPDVPTFLKLIGRGLGSHASKFPSWESLFSLTSSQLAELGVEPPRTRRYLIQWRQRFCRGQFGIGGDLKHVSPEGTAELRVLEHEGADPLKPAKYVVNVPEGQIPAETAPGALSRVSGFSVKGAKTIVGPYALPAKDGAVRITATEGMWEDKRGRKIDGGERRRTQVRYKKRIQERREMREKGEKY
ncbi:IGR protein motif-domain-containing protein [Truncatella angustata]|uniref:Small ribosomal subunit protein mS41 n=1 Tax=Truncatella angustata TaxID=152316 RepID=A0A9P8ZVN5_9PEZI|nr:IGR protein motif-domain-containing protein [Truncatella angustata]KAH6648909.1 IGR protein motif-domain-containing protein [Truncatella angustata]